MTDIASLGIEIDSSSASKAADDLDRLAAAGGRAEGAASSASKTWSEYSRAQTQAAQSGVRNQRAQENAAAAAKNAADATKRQQAELANLLGRIDPVTAALDRLDKQQKELAKFRNVLDAETFATYQGKIDQARAGLGGFEDSLKRTGASAKQTQAALRQLPAQFSDIFVSLQAGQSPLTVFLQQGAQIKDSFGGIGPALRETASFARGLITPFSLAGGAAIALGAAYVKGAQESVEFNKAIILTGNAAGVTADQLATLAAEIDGVVGTQAQAAQALTSLASSGKIASDQFGLVAKAAISLQESTGIAIEDTIAQYEKLADSPTEAAAKLNKSINFLTLDLFKQIQALEEQGRTAEAAAVAQEALARTQIERAAEVGENLGILEVAWKGVGKAAAEAWDFMLGIGRKETVDQEIDRLQKQLKAIETAGQRGGRFAEQVGVFGNEQQIRQQLAAAQERKKASEDGAKAEGERNKQVNQGIDAETAAAKAKKDAQEEFDRIRLSNLTKEQRLEREIANIRKTGQAAGISSTEIEDQVEAARKQAESRATTRRARTPAVRDDAATRLLINLREQEASLNAQLETGVKLSRAQQELVEFNQKIADLKSKDILTAEQKSLLNGEDAIRKQLELNAGIEEEIKKRAQSVDNERLRIQILRETGQTRAANDAQLDLEYTQKRLEFERDGNVEALKRLDTLKKINEIQQETGQKPGTVEGVSQAPDIVGVDADIGGAAGELRKLDKQAEELEEWRANELEKQMAFLEAKAVNEETYAERIANVEEQYAIRRNAVEREINNARLSAASEFFGSLATLSKSENKKLAAIGKAAAIAQATIDGFAGVGKALGAFPPPFNFIAAAAVGAAAAINVANIAGVGFRSGGYTGSGSDNDIAGPVHRNEFVFDAAATARIGVGNLEALRSGSAQATAMTANVVQMPQRQSRNVSVTQNIMVQGNVDRRTSTQIASEATRKQRMAQSRFG